MLDLIPHLHKFSRLYWNQMGDETYSNIETAFRQFLADATRLPDRGEAMRRTLHRELLLISAEDYAAWVQAHRTDPATIKAVGGRFIHARQVSLLLALLEEEMGHDA